MSNTKKIKKSLLLSVLSLVLCCSMLLGTTFAWFTDSVSSANNIIKSGNLDIELEYWNGTAWVDVEGKSDILTNELWEPGATEVAYFRIANAGSLALKYQFGINIVSETEGVNVAGGPLKLSDYIQFGVVENVNGKTGAYANRDAAVAAVANNAKKISAGYTKAGSLLSNESIYLALVVYMPETVGNEANHKTGTAAPQIDLGISIFATQFSAESESDSFDNLYDEDAWHPEMQVYTADDLQDALTNAEPGTEVVLMDNIKVDEPITIPAAPATYSMRSTPNAVVLNLNGKTITTAYNESTQKHQYAIDNYGNLVINGGTIEARGIYNREGANLTVNGTKIVNMDMNGGSCVWSYGGSVVLNNANLIGYTGCVYSDGYLEINGGTYTCYSAILEDGTQLTPTYTIRSNSELVINGGNFTSRHGLVSVKGTAVINGGTYTMTSIGAITSHVIYMYGNDPQVTVNGGTFNCDLRTAQANGSSMICINTTSGTAVVNGGIYNLSPAKYVADGYQALETNNDHYIVVADDVAGLVYNEEQLRAALTTGGKYIVMDSFTLDKDETITVPASVTAMLDLNGNTISGTLSGTGNKDLFLVKGNLTMTDGSVELKVTQNQGWNAMSTIFDITAGGVVTLDNVVADNKGGTDMNFVAHLNNWGAATLNVTNSTLKATYIAVRAFNSGYDMNNITIKNSTLEGKYCFWVHNYTSEGKDDSTLNVNIINNGNTFTYTGKAPIMYGFSNELYFNAEGIEIVTVSTLEELNAALKNNTQISVSGEIKDATVKLPANLSNVTISGGTFVNSTISAADGNSYSYVGLTFDGITFDNSRLLFTGWRNGEETLKDLTITNCTFKNLNDTTNTAPVHINKDAAEAVVNFTFTNNVIDGTTGGSKSGIYLQATGKVVVSNNVINKVAFRPFVIQITTNDGIADEFIVTGNTFSGSSVGRAQGLGSDAAGTDNVTVVVTNNIFKGITDSQQICYWNFNEETTSVDLSKNYYDINIVANPSRIYYNSAATGVEDLISKGVTSYYTELNADGTINLDSLVDLTAN